MKSVVVDASVAAKWILPSALEPFSDHAVRLLERNVLKEINIVVPDLFWAELGNILWKAVRTGRALREDAQLGLKIVTDHQFLTIPSLDLLDSAFQIAGTFDRSFYDCLYVALAESHGVELVTADEKLANALGTRFRVRWLGAM